MNYNKRIRTVQNKDQSFSELELDLIHTPTLQRLYDLHQLGFTDRVYVDASHNRFSHVIGVVHAAQKIMDALRSNLKKDEDRELKFNGWKENGFNGGSPPKYKDFDRLIEDKQAAVRLMALLHDITHSPYGHTLEDEIELIEEKHDDPERQDEAFFHLFAEWIFWLHIEMVEPEESLETLEQFINDYLLSGRYRFETSEGGKLEKMVVEAGYNVFVACETIESFNGRAGLEEFIKSLHFAFSGLLHLEVAHKEKPKADLLSFYDDEKRGTFSTSLRLIEKVLGSLEEPIRIQDHERFYPKRDAFLLDIIGNTICADLLDYAKRDSVNSGLSLDYDSDRIVENFILVPYRMNTPTSGTHPFEGNCVRTAINLITNKLRLDVVGELISLLNVRYYLNERVLFHPTKCIAGACLGASLQWIGWHNLPKMYRSFGDSVFLNEVKEIITILKTTFSTGKLDDQYLHHEAVREHLNQQFKTYPVNSIRMSLRALIESFSEPLHSLEEHYRYYSRLGSEYKNRNVEAFIKKKNPSEAVKKQFILSNIEFLERISIAKKVKDYRKEIGAAERLMLRIGSRRYLKTAFRLLPQGASTSQSRFNSSQIAEFFTNATCRKIAEREIERRCGFPKGTIVIHCPPAKGPVKVAKILVTTNKPKEVPVELCNLDQIDDRDLQSVLKGHATLVDSLEKMYGSTWRLIVSVARPYYRNHKRIESTIGKVLFQVLTGDFDDEDNSIPNDPFMHMEAGAMESHISEVDAKELEKKMSEAIFTGNRRIDPNLKSRLDSGIEDLMKRWGGRMTVRKHKGITNRIEEYKLKIPEGYEVIKNSLEPSDVDSIMTELENLFGES